MLIFQANWNGLDIGTDIDDLCNIVIEPILYIVGYFPTYFEFLMDQSFLQFTETKNSEPFHRYFTWLIFNR